MKKLLAVLLVVVFCLAIVSVAVAATPTITKSIGKYPLGVKLQTWLLVQKGGASIVTQNGSVVNESGQVSIIVQNGSITELGTNRSIIVQNGKIVKQTGKIGFIGENGIVSGADGVRVIIKNGAVLLIGSNGIIVDNARITEVSIINENYFKDIFLPALG